MKTRIYAAPAVKHVKGLMATVLTDNVDIYEYYDVLPPASTSM